MDESPWTFDVVAGRRSDTVNLVDGTTFAVSGRSGVIGEGATQGLYLLDTRVLSSWRVDVEGGAAEPLTFVPAGPFSGVFVSRVEQPGQADSPIALIQRRHVGRGMREDIEIRNHGPACDVAVRLHIATDLAGLFEVKSGHTVERSSLRVTVDASELRLHDDDGVAPIEAVVVRWSTAPDSTDVADGSVTWHVALEEGGAWATCLQVSVVAGGLEIEPSHRCGEPIEEAIPVGRLRRWRQTTPDVVSDHPMLDRTVEQAVDDLGALRIFDPDHVERVVVAAGAPWFMALFGRDSLLTSWMTLPFDQDLANGVLAELADTQGTVTDARTDEQPGRILHEVRFDRLSSQLLGGENTYYGTIDATPLFVMVVAELARWSGVTDRIVGLMPTVERAIEWIEHHGDRDGDGFVEYLRSHPSGLEHQGWKDSWDGIRHADGSVAVPPIALGEVQGYVYAAYRGRASLARALGEDPSIASEYDYKAEELRRRFDDAFWLDDLGWYAVGLDEHKRPIRSLTSNLGHLLWCGIVPEHRARHIAKHLLSPSMFTGWGLRTLAADCVGYNPLSYHCGSVWPHDSAIAVAGLSRYGFDAEAQTLADALIDAAGSCDGRLPELFGGFARVDVAAPVPYPTSCSPQAWASASPLLLVRSMLGLEPDVAAGRIRLRPRLTSRVGRLTLSGVEVGGQRIRIEAEGEMAIVAGSDLDVTVS